MIDSVKTTTALLYLRVSKDEQRYGHSIETQEDRELAYCDRVYGPGNYKVIKIIDDESGWYGTAKTGVSKKIRRGWKKCQELIETQPIDVMLVYRIDRQARNLRQLLQFYEDVLVPNGTRLISVTEGIDTGDPNGVQTMQICGMMAEWQRTGIVERNKDAASKRMEEGYFVGQIGYGWRWAPTSEEKGQRRRTILPVPEEGVWLKRMADWYLSGWSITRIAYELNVLGVTPPSGNRADKWSIRAVHRLLRNPLHAGLVRTMEDHTQGAHFEHRFYEPEVYYRLMDEMSGRKRWRTNTKATRRHLLAGIITCTRCGRRLYVAVSQGPYRSYRCRGEATPEGEKCKRIYLNADMIEQAVTREVLGYCGSPEILALAEEEAIKLLGSEDEKLTAEREQLRSQRSIRQEQFRNWADGYSKGLFTDEQFQEFNRELLQQQAEIDERLLSVESALSQRDRRQSRLDEVLSAMRDLASVWEKLNFDERRHLLQTLIEKLSADRIGNDTVVKLKLCLLPEKEIIVPMLGAKKPKGKLPGVTGLSPRELAFLKHTADGRTLKEIETLWQVSDKCVKSVGCNIRRHLGLHDLMDAAALARPRIEAMLQFLPLEGRSPGATMWPKKELPETLRVILPYVASGATTPEIARETGLKRSTVAGRRTRLLEFFGAKSSYDLGQRARAAGLL